MTAEPAFSRVALAFLSILCGAMGFALGVIAAPAQSTALAADGLIFLRESALAWLAMWVLVGAFHRTALIARLIGLAMIGLGAGVLAIAVGRLAVGSTPNAMLMAGMGSIALAAQLMAGALSLRYRREALSLGAVWGVTRDSCAAHLTVIAAAVVLFATKSNLGDIAVGAAIAALFAVNGLVMVVRGRLPAPGEN